MECNPARLLWKWVFDRILFDPLKSVKETDGFHVMKTHFWFIFHADKKTIFPEWNPDKKVKLTHGPWVMGQSWLDNHPEYHTLVYIRIKKNEKLSMTRPHVQAFPDKTFVCVPTTCIKTYHCEFQPMKNFMRISIKNISNCPPMSKIPAWNLFLSISNFTENLVLLKWVASSRWSFGPNSAWG